MPLEDVSKSGLVLVATVNTTFGEALVDCLINQFSIRAATAPTAQEMLEVSDGHSEPKLILLDYGQGQTIDPGIEELAAKVPTALILDRPSASVARVVIEGSFKGIVLKSTPLKKAIAAIRLMLGGDQYLSDLLPKTSAQLEPFLQDLRLTRRERSVIELIARGYSNKAIEETLQISAAGVSSIVHKLFVKFDVRNRTELAIQWNAKGSVWPAELWRA